MPTSIGQEIKPRTRFWLSPGGVAILYITLSAVWILCSEAAFAALSGSPELASLIRWIEGIGYVAVVCVLLFVLLRAWQRERNQTEEEIRSSRDWFKMMADHSPVMIWIAGKDRMFTFVNERWVRFTGRPLEEELGEGWTRNIHRDDCERTVRTFYRAFEAREELVMQYRLRRADGEYRWMRDYGTPLYGFGGEFRGYIGSCVDITESKAEQERQTLLMRELDHRVKNSLAAVLSVADCTFASTQTREEFRTAFTGRVHAMARAHSAIAKGRWTGLCLSELVRTIVVDPLNSPAGGRVTMRGPDVIIPAQGVPPLAMILHELGTNALKYGGLSSSAGAVVISWTTRTDAEGDRFVDAVWAESGGPPLLSQPLRGGLGMRLVRGLAETELGGRFEQVFRPEGLESRFSMSLDRWRNYTNPGVLRTDDAEVLA